MAPSYNMADGHEASYGVSQDGNTTVAVRSVKPLKFREVYVGAATLEFYWVNTGRSASWVFTPTISDPMPASHTETVAEDGKTQIINVDLGKGMFPASGILNTSVIGEIFAPAVHFDVSAAFDLWIFLLRSPWFPLKIGIEKSPLSISHNFAQATAEVEAVNSGEGGEQSLRADLSVHGEGFKWVWLSLKRSANRASTEEVIGKITSGMETFSWKPRVNNFEFLFVTSSSMSLGLIH